MSDHDMGPLPSRDEFRPPPYKPRTTTQLHQIAVWCVEEADLCRKNGHPMSLAQLNAECLARAFLIDNPPEPANDHDHR